MKLYCLVEDRKDEEGNVYKSINQGPTELPQNTSFVSNLNSLDETSLKELGWLPYKKQSEDKEVYVSSKYEILEDKVIEIIETRNKTEEELNIDKEKREYYLWQDLRKQRDQLLSESDKMVMVDKWEKMNEFERERISTYRQSLRDLPDLTKDPAEVNFPVL